MTEQKVKNRGWVKNVAIIFLAVMLVLTFFSNTIMNMSLPEAAVQYVQSGAITTQIRGTGTITAKETYEVKTTTSRKVQSVLVTTGQQVKVGDVLMLFAAGEGSEIEELQKQLDEAKYAYQEKLINASGGGSEVARAQEKLQEAIADRDAKAVPYTVQDIEAAKQRLEAAKKEYQELTYALEDAGGYVEGGSGDTLKQLRDTMETANQTYQANLLRYDKDLQFMDRLSRYAAAHRLGYSQDECAEAIAAAFAAAPKDSTIIGYFSADADRNTVAERNNLGLSGVDIESFTDSSGNKLVNTLTSQALSDISAGFNAVQESKTSYVTAKDAYDKALAQTQDQNAELNRMLTEAKRYMDAQQSEYDSMVEKKAAYDAAKDTVVSCESALANLLKSSQTASLDLSRQLKAIQELEAKIAELSAGSTDENGVVTGGQVVSEVNGVVKDINVSAGSSTDPSSAALTIEVPDRGYSISMSVTNEQAQKVVIGDSAEISTGYWGGSDMQARLVGVRADTQNPQSGGKLLVFDVTGSDIESGTQASISIGQRSQNYETIVPNSALRSDSNGSFVLVVVAKSSPLGNRFVATRVDVTELAKDDVNTAVSGGISAYDMVLTTSTKPVEDGMLVRLPD